MTERSKKAMTTPKTEPLSEQEQEQMKRDASGHAVKSRYGRSLVLVDKYHAIRLLEERDTLQAALQAEKEACTAWSQRALPQEGARHLQKRVEDLARQQLNLQQEHTHERFAMLAQLQEGLPAESMVGCASDLDTGIRATLRWVTKLLEEREDLIEASQEAQAAMMREHDTLQKRLEDFQTCRVHGRAVGCSTDCLDAICKKRIEELEVKKGK